MNDINLREIKKKDNQQIAAVIHEVFIANNFPETEIAFADTKLDFMFKTFDKPRSIYFVIKAEGKIAIHKIRF